MSQVRVDFSPVSPLTDTPPPPFLVRIIWKGHVELNCHYLLFLGGSSNRITPSFLCSWWHLLGDHISLVPSMSLCTDSGGGGGGFLS